MTDGVRFNPATEEWEARADGVLLGSFETAGQAHAAYLADARARMLVAV